MDKIEEMGEGINVQDVPVHRTTRDDFTSKGKRSCAAGNVVNFYCICKLLVEFMLRLIFLQSFFFYFKTY